MSEYWRDKAVLVTGGSAGLGFALAGQLCRRGARVAITARGAERLEHAANQLADDGGHVMPVVADLTRQDDVDQLFASLSAQWPELDVLINCAGRSMRGGALDTTTEQFTELLDVNFLAAVRCTRAAAPRLVESRGHLVNIGSLASKVASRYLGAYPASKFALAAYTQQLRLELDQQGVHVMLVCPGPIGRTDTMPRYTAPDGDSLPEAAHRPGGGARVKKIDPEQLAGQILRGCQQRRAELVIPWRARLLFSLSAWSPRLGDWLLGKLTS